VDQHQGVIGAVGSVGWEIDAGLKREGELPTLKGRKRGVREGRFVDR